MGLYLFTSGVKCTGDCHVCYVDEEKPTEKTTTAKTDNKAENTTENMMDGENMNNLTKKIHSGCHPIHTIMEGIGLFQN